MADFLAPSHPSRYIVRYAFLVLLLAYICSPYLRTAPAALNWIILVGAGYAGLLSLNWLWSYARPHSDVAYASVLLLDMAALGLALPYDPTPSCPAMLAMLLMVFDNGFRREAKFYLTSLLCALLVGASVCVLRLWMFGPEYGWASLWLFAFVCFACGYGYFLFKSLIGLRQRLGAVFELADASDDFLFALSSQNLQIRDANRATRSITSEGKTLLDVFDIRASQADQFVQDALEKGTASREWALRNDDDRLIEIKARSFNDRTRLACTGRDMSLHHERAERLLEQSRSDGLTGLHNRRALDRRLFTEWRRMLRADKMLAVLMIDIDWFKPYNDVLGHQAGDECLQRIASLMRQNMWRAGDFLARYGGEEFTMIAPDCDQEGAQIIAQRLINLVASENIKHPASPLGHITISIGVAAARPEPMQESQFLLKLADQALYQAKQFGRNRAVLASSS